MAPEVWEKNRDEFEMEVQMGSQVNATERAVIIMEEEWVRGGLAEVVPD